MPHDPPPPRAARRRAALLGLLASSLLGLTLTGCGGSDDDAGGVQPRALPGPYAIACSNVAQDFSGVSSGDDTENVWEGRPAADGTPRYAADLLSDPANVLSVEIDAPDNADLYGSFAGKRVGFVVLACYPTAADNPRADFHLPTGQVVPRMQTGDQPPLFADASTRYPLIAFSHGLAGSPLSDEHLDVLTWLASHGYAVVAPFHGDPRFTDLRIDDIGDAVAVLTDLDDAVAMQALRPLALSAALDRVLADPQWRDHLDVAQVGGFGASLGGEVMLLMGGAALTTSPSLSAAATGTDVRLKAAVGYVPYFGQPLLPAFGREQSGLDSVTLPYLAIGGTSDTTAPLALTRQGMDRLRGPRMLVTLGGVEHGFDARSGPDIMTWSLIFLDALVRGDPVARAQLSTMTHVNGGGGDTLVLPLVEPLAP